MKKPLYSPPDPFSMLPLLSILPSVGKIQRLESFTSSLFARYESVSNVTKGSVEINRELAQRIGAEEGMLRLVLDWLQVKPEADG